MVGCIHSSNVLATVNPVERLAELAHSVGADVGGRGAERAPHAGGCGFFGLRLLRVQRAQDARPRGSGCCGGSRRSWMPWTRSLAGRDDPGGPPRALYLERVAPQVRGRDHEHSPGRGARGGRAHTRRSGDGERSGARAEVGRVRLPEAPRLEISSSTAPGRTERASSPSCRTCIRTTSPSSWTRRA